MIASELLETRWNRKNRKRRTALILGWISQCPHDGSNDFFEDNTSYRRSDSRVSSSSLHPKHEQNYTGRMRARSFLKGRWSPVSHQHNSDYQLVQWFSVRDRVLRCWDAVAIEFCVSVLTLESNLFSGWWETSSDRV